MVPLADQLARAAENFGSGFDKAIEKRLVVATAKEKGSDARALQMGDRDFVGAIAIVRAKKDLANAGIARFEVFNRPQRGALGVILRLERSHQRHLRVREPMQQSAIAPQRPSEGHAQMGVCVNQAGTRQHPRSIDRGVVMVARRISFIHLNNLSIFNDEIAAIDNPLKAIARNNRTP